VCYLTEVNVSKRKRKKNGETAECGYHGNFVSLRHKRILAVRLVFFVHTLSLFVRVYVVVVVSWTLVCVCGLCRDICSTFFQAQRPPKKFSCPLSRRSLLGRSTRSRGSMWAFNGQRAVILRVVLRLFPRRIRFSLP